MKKKLLVGTAVIATMVITFYLNIKPGNIKPTEFLFMNLEALATPEEGISADDCVMPLDFIAQDKGTQFERVCDSRTGAKIFPCLPVRQGFAIPGTRSKCTK